MNYTPMDVKKILKQGLIYMLIALPFVMVVAVCLTILKAPLWLVLLGNVTVGGGVIFLCYVIHSKIKENKANKQKNKPKKYDPFKD